MLQGCGGEGDREKAMSLLDESLAISSESGRAAIDGAGAVPAGNTEGLITQTLRSEWF